MVGDSVEHAFDAMWRSLAAKGCVDEIDGAEYDRVIAEWTRCGKPNWTATQIVQCANDVQRTQT